ncbi:hypothetical protein RMCBS344292_05339 [Rhizopus microsporus]|nr:hypothetical protein RMCBS344292_05339 [Rhizopus microsporus]
MSQVTIAGLWVEHFVKDFIMQNKVTVFSRNFLPECIQAKELLNQNNIQFLDVDIEKGDYTLEFDNSLKAKTGQHNYPMIFIKQQYIGNYNDLVNLHHSGELQRMLQ